MQIDNVGLYGCPFQSIQEQNLKACRCRHCGNKIVSAFCSLRRAKDDYHFRRALRGQTAFRLAGIRCLDLIFGLESLGAFTAVRGQMQDVGSVGGP